MRKFLLPLICIFCFISVNGQSKKIGDISNEELSMIRTLFGKEKKELMSEYMQVSKNDSIQFWQIYNEYEAARQKLATERLKIIHDYANQYEKLDNKSAEQLAKRALENDHDLLKVYQKYFKKMSPVVGGRSTAKFFQLEMFFQETIRTAIQSAIPFIDELNNEKKMQSKQL